MKKILMAAVGLMLIAGGIIAMFPYIEELQLKGEVLRSCSVSTGGGMLGGYTNYYLKRQKDGTVTLTVTGKETHADRETTAVCEVDPKELDKINEIVLKYHLYPASRKKYSDHQVMDAAFVPDFGISEAQPENEGRLPRGGAISVFTENGRSCNHGRTAAGDAVPQKRLYTEISGRGSF